MPTGVYDHWKIRGVTEDVDERFWKKVVFEDSIFPENGCMLWTGWKSHNGYGRFAVGLRSNQKKFPAHRWIWERMYGPIAEGFQLDHLCRVRHCVNPDHLEPVTPSTNIRRGETMNRKRASTGRFMKGK